jgi:hypothetical protein
MLAGGDEVAHYNLLRACRPCKVVRRADNNNVPQRAYASVDRCLRTGLAALLFAGGKRRDRGSLHGAATVARLRAEPEFLADLDASKAELAAARAKGLPPQSDCKFEAAALAETPPQAP